MRCCLDRKTCDLQDICARCEAKGLTFCYRSNDQLWLYKAIEQISLDSGARERALDEARSTTFANSSDRLGSLPSLGQDFLRDSDLPVIYLTSNLDDSRATSHIAVNFDSLAAMLLSMPKSFTKQIKDAMEPHIPAAGLPFPQSSLSDPECDVLASAQAAFRIFGFLFNVARVVYHASPRSSISAREVSCFFIECCARLLAEETEEILKRIRPIVRRNRAPGQGIQYALGIYYRIVAGLQGFQTESAIDIILEPLTLRAEAVMSNLAILYQTIFGGTETLQTFADNNIHVAPQLKDLHMSHEMLDKSNTQRRPMDIAWSPMNVNPFRKDFSIGLCDLLTQADADRLTWNSKLGHVLVGMPSPLDDRSADQPRFEIDALGASEAGPSLPGRVSQEPTLYEPGWDDSSTLIQSLSEVEETVETNDESSRTRGDVKSPLILAGITGDVGNPSKRALSPDSYLASPYSLPKRAVIDEQELQGSTEHHFAEALYGILTSRESSGAIDFSTSPVSPL